MNCLILISLHEVNIIQKLRQSQTEYLQRQIKFLRVFQIWILLRSGFTDQMPSALNCLRYIAGSGLKILHCG